MIVATTQKDFTPALSELFGMQVNMSAMIKFRGRRSDFNLSQQSNNIQLASTKNTQIGATLSRVNLFTCHMTFQVELGNEIVVGG